LASSALDAFLTSPQTLFREVGPAFSQNLLSQDVSSAKNAVNQEEVREKLIRMDFSAAGSEFGEQKIKAGRRAWKPIFPRSTYERIALKRPKSGDSFQ